MLVDHVDDAGFAALGGVDRNRVDGETDRRCPGMIGGVGKQQIEHARLHRLELFEGGHSVRAGKADGQCAAVFLFDQLHERFGNLLGEDETFRKAADHLQFFGECLRTGKRDHGGRTPCNEFFHRILP